MTVGPSGVWDCERPAESEADPDVPSLPVSPRDVKGSRCAPICTKFALLEQLDATWIIDSTMRAMAELHSGADEKPMIHSKARSMVEMQSRSVSTPPPFHLL